MKREVRTFRGAQLRAKDSETPGADGYAAVFNSTTDLGWFKEVIKPGAFTRALREKQDVRCLMNHDENFVLGRTKAGTLALSEDEQGLKFDCEFPDTQGARDLRTSMQRGDIDACSFGFSVTKQSWTQTQREDGTMEEVRQIEDVDLFDVSIVTYPAYEATSCEARSLWPNGVPADLEKRVKQPDDDPDATDDGGEDDECDCECDRCKEGRCEECSKNPCTAENCRCDDMGGDDETNSALVPAETRTEAKTKRVDGEDLTADCFLIVGDAEKTDTWKLPVKFSSDEKTKSHLRNALARFNQMKGVSDDEKAKAWKRLVSLCKKNGIDVSEEKNSRWHRHLTREQIESFRSNDDAADCIQACQENAHQIKINIEEIMALIARAVEDPDEAISSLGDEFAEIQRLAEEAVAECGKRTDGSEADRSAAPAQVEATVIDEAEVAAAWARALLALLESENE